MLVNATEMLIKARDGHYGVPQFNINNLEWTKSVLTACEEMKSPVILGVSEGAGKYMTGFKTVAAMVSAMVDSMGITVPVALHLDHGTYEGCKACIEAGFSSIMFDGSHYSIEENVEKTKELVALAHAKGLSIEAEVGSIGGVEDGVVGAGEIADPEECAFSGSGSVQRQIMHQHHHAVLGEAEIDLEEGRQHREGLFARRDTILGIPLLHPAPMSANDDIPIGNIPEIGLELLERGDFHRMVFARHRVVGSLAAAGNQQQGGGNR